MRHLEHVVEARAKLRAVSEGYLEQAKVAIAALRPRESQQAPIR